MEIQIPKIGMTFSRALMPQIGKDIKSNLTKNDVPFKEVRMHPNDLKSTQSEFDLDKVRLMMLEPFKSKTDIIISNDNYILDGHHRWLVAFNKDKKITVLQVDLPILELMRLTKSFETTEYRPLMECVRTLTKIISESRKYK
jgi:hypothetical protein